MTLRIIGDAHGKYRDYCKVAAGATHSLQLGDMGIAYDNLGFERVDSNLADKDHMFFGGNHDNYDDYYDLPYSLGDYGEYELGGVKFFYIRGAFSIDNADRRAYSNFNGVKVWWEEEELTASVANDCAHTYAQARPDIVVTHGCPTDVAKIIGKPGVLKMFGFDPETFNTNTQKLLQACFELHQPKEWYFGHFHMNREVELRGTKFRCINELSYVDIEP